jgi:hypothetical protein
VDQSCQTLDRPMGPCSGGSAPTVRITLHPCRDRRSPWGAEVIAARDQTTGGARRGNCRAAADRARDSRSRYTARHSPARYRAGGVVGTRFPRVRQHRVTQRRIATCTSSGTISLPDGITERISASSAVYAAVSSRYPRAWSRWLRGNAQRCPPPKSRRDTCLERITRTASNP